ncbi:MAG: hypothetical protein QM346_17655 [Chloroflexota bacterium]|nr:hypothetical protein [Chloroflexota bacterium]
MIQNTPVPDLSDPLTRDRLADLALQAHDLQRRRDLGDETAHVFGLPSLALHEDASLLQAGLRLDQAEQNRRAALAAVQAEIDDLAFDLYGLDETDRAAIRAEMGGASDESPHEPPAGPEEQEAEDEEEAAPPEDLPLRVQNLLMWCVGVAFGRWDVRMALDSSLLPALQGPFDPLPRCAPGALIGTDGLPARKDHIAGEAWLRSRKDVLDLPGPGMPGAALDADAYPFPVAWDGILVDDENHPADLVARVEQVIRLLWGDRGDDIIQEACDILGFPDLRSYFRDPRKGFYAFHIKRYSKSRRKAPIYWLLQPEKRSYGIWLYVHRMGEMTLLEAARKPYADSKVLLEEARLDELQQSLGALEGSARKRREREIERQQKLVDEVTSFRNTLDKVAAMKLPPDLNDGVIISIAPLHALTPWNEAQKMWAQLATGAYEWSAMAQQMRRRGFVKVASSR